MTTPASVMPAAVSSAIAALLAVPSDADAAGWAQHVQQARGAWTASPSPLLHGHLSVGLIYMARFTGHGGDVAAHHSHSSHASHSSHVSHVSSAGGGWTTPPVVPPPAPPSQSQPPSSPGIATPGTTTPPAPPSQPAPPSSPANPVSPDLLGVLMSDPRCSTFANLVTLAGLANEFHGTDPRTVCAPVNDAFTDPNALTRLQQIDQRGALVTFVLGHLFAGTRSRVTLSVFSSLTACGGQSIPIASTDDVVSIGDGRIVKANILATNGVVHLIDHTVIPLPTPAPQPGH